MGGRRWAQARSSCPIDLYLTAPRMQQYRVHAHRTPQSVLRVSFLPVRPYDSRELINVSVGNVSAAVVVQPG